MEEYDRAKRAAASLVSSRMYTCREVEERLRRKKISRDVARTGRKRLCCRRDFKRCRIRKGHTPKTR